MANLIDREGIFKASITDWALDEQKGSGIPKFTIEFDATEYLENAQWYDWREYKQTIRGYFYPFMKTGDPNTTTIDNLKNSIGWDGLSLESLGNGNYKDVIVQITIKNGSYKGNPRMEVAWINPGDFDPTLKKLDEKGVKRMASNWDAKLRAIGGAKSGSTATKPKPPPMPPATTKPPTVKAARDKAWAAFVNAQVRGEKLKAQEVPKAWEYVFSVMFEGREESTLTAAEWEKMATEGPDKILPF